MSCTLAGSVKTPQKRVRAHLKRGHACLNCKRKCDGHKPVCHPCRTNPKSDECEYSDEKRGRTRALEKTIAHLEARLHELEHPEATPSVTLYHPYTSMSIAPLVGFQVALSPSTPGPPPLLSQRHLPLESPLSSPSSAPNIPNVLESIPSRLESDVCHVFSFCPLETFRPYASEFGFFLDWSRMMGQWVSRGTSGSSALLNALGMLGAHISGDSQRANILKQKALHSAVTAVTDGAFLHALQAEVLLSYFFLCTGHFLEARIHTATAAALVVGGGLHEIRSRHAPVIQIVASDEGELHLRSPTDMLEEGESINGFWTVFMLEKCLSLVLEPYNEPYRKGVFGADDIQIDTPWPLDLSDYQKGLLTSDIRGDSTVRKYRMGVPSRQGSSSIIARKVKAFILLDQAVHVHGLWRSNLPEPEGQSWWSAFSFIVHEVESLRTVTNPAPPHGTDLHRTILLTHSLLNAATIRLHSVLTHNALAMQKCIAAAQDMFLFGGTSPEPLEYLNPMISTLWMVAFDVLVKELCHLRAADSAAPQGGAKAKREEEMSKSLRDGYKALSRGSSDSLLTRKVPSVIWGERAILILNLDHQRRKAQRWLFCM
ncbi:hypothetical protein C8R47DRAFT_997865 [Mycena vitilis]|nr:hypothetical protein C8R47DRAFT_997865 [Mycena vitilis]